MNNWGQVKILSASDKADDDFFGGSVAVSGDTAVVGAQGANSGGTDRGQAYVFDIATVTVTYPNGGEGYAINNGYGIQWQYTGDPGQTVKIELLKGGVLNTVLTPSTSIGTDGIRLLLLGIVSPTQPIGDDYSIRISSTIDSAINDTSDAPFSINPYSGVILKAPNGGETWQQGSTYAINWDHYSSWHATTAELYLLKTDQVVLTLNKTVPIGSNHQGSYDWTVPQSLVPGNDYKIRIYIIPGGDSDDSNTSFSITAVSVTPPVASFSVNITVRDRPAYRAVQ